MSGPDAVMDRPGANLTGLGQSTCRELRDRGHRGLQHREGMESLGRPCSFPANPGPFGPVVAGPSDGSRPRNPCQIDPLPQIEPEVDGLSTRILDDSSMNMADLERPSFGRNTMGFSVRLTDVSLGAECTRVDQ